MLSTIPNINKSFAKELTPIQQKSLDNPGIIFTEPVKEEKKTQMKKAIKEA